jgi:hypothetical protein
MCAAVSACPHRKLVSKVSVRHFCRLSPQALSFLNETISEGRYLFQPAACRHVIPLDLYECDQSKIAQGSSRSPSAT